MEISPVIHKAIETLAMDMDLRFYSDYSGRGMYGNKTIGIIFNDFDQAARFFMELGATVKTTQIRGQWRTDNMGLQIIAYLHR